jgi:hypothetical protein
MPRGVSRLDEAQLQGRLWTPALLPSLALWLDAGDLSTLTIPSTTLVSQWRDKSGYNRHFAQSNINVRPLYRAQGFNGRPCLENATGDSMAIGSSGLGRNVGCITCAIVGSHPVAAFTSNSSELSITSGTSGARFFMSPNPNATNAYGFASKRLDAESVANFSSSTDALANRGSPWIRIGQMVYSGAVGYHWTNGVQDMTALAGGASGNTSDTNSVGGSIFSLTPNGTKLSEIVLTHSELNQKEREALEGYLAWHWWGDANTLQATHRFRNRPSLIGD